MKDQSVAILFANKRYSGDTEDYVLLYQEPYDPGVGVTTTVDLVKGLSDALYGTDSSSFDVDCGIDEDWGFNTGLYAYPSSPKLSFNVGLTHGYLAQGTIAYITVQEMVQFRLSATGTLKFPAVSIKKMSWYGDVYDIDGKNISGPKLIASGRVLSSDDVVYGTALVAYTVYRVLYGIRITPREDSVENVYQSVAYARWNGGVVMREIDAPTGADDDYSKDVNCGWRSITNISPEDPSDPPIVDTKDQEIFIDYCSQKEAS